VSPESDYPTRIVILSERSEPKDLSYPTRIVILSERSEPKDLSYPTRTVILPARLGGSEHRQPRNLSPPPLLSLSLFLSVTCEYY
jgi:hypothetical protein